MKHLIGTADLTKDKIVGLVDEADCFKKIIRGREVRKLSALRGRTIYNLFYENSIRTRLSLETAGRWINADVINILASSSSVKKGESLKDAVLILDAIGGDAIVVRHLSLGAAQLIAKWTEEFGDGPSVINASDGKRQHPTQALLDVVTLRQCLGGIERRRAVIVDDILRLHITRSNADLLSKLGAEIVPAAPPTLLSFGTGTWPVRITYRVEDEICDTDAIMMLHVQQKCMHGGFFPSHRGYATRCGLSKAREEMFRDDCIVMYPEPTLRGMEISNAVADLPRTAVLRQVVSGVHVRMVVLFTLLTSGVSANSEEQV